MPFEEKAGLDWLIRKIKEQKDKESLLAFVSSFCSRRGDSPEQSRERGRAFLEECGGTVDGVLKMAEETRPCYTLDGEDAGTTAGSVREGIRARDEEASRQSRVQDVLSRCFQHLRRSQARADVRRALLATALDVQLDGPDALKNHPDPVVGGPFELVAFEGGFELRSKFKPTDDKPWVLIVGQRGK